MIRHARKLSALLWPLAFGVVLLVLWQTQALHAIMGVDTFVLPLPTRILAIIADNGPKIMGNVSATLTVSVVGLAAGSLLGYGIAVLATFFPRWGAGGLGIVSAFNAIPIVALAPVFNNWTKDVSSDPSFRSM